MRFSGYNRFLNNSLWRACFTVNPCSWSCVHKFIQLYCTTTELYIFTKRLLVLFFRDLVAYVKHVINNLNCLFFADSKNNNKKNLTERKYLWCFKMLFKTLYKFQPTYMVQWELKLKCQTTSPVSGTGVQSVNFSIALLSLDEKLGEKKKATI